MLNALDGEPSVTLMARQVSDAAANGTWRVPGRITSQWISSLITVTR